MCCAPMERAPRPPAPSGDVPCRVPSAAWTAAARCLPTSARSLASARIQRCVVVAKGMDDRPLLRWNVCLLLPRLSSASLRRGARSERVASLLLERRLSLRGCLRPTARVSLAHACSLCGQSMCCLSYGVRFGDASGVSSWNRAMRHGRVSEEVSSCGWMWCE